MASRSNGRFASLRIRLIGGTVLRYLLPEVDGFGAFAFSSWLDHQYEVGCRVIAESILGILVADEAFIDDLLSEEVRYLFSMVAVPNTDMWR